MHLARKRYLSGAAAAGRPPPPLYRYFTSATPHRDQNNRRPRLADVADPDARRALAAAWIQATARGVAARARLFAALTPAQRQGWEEALRRRAAADEVEDGLAMLSARGPPEDTAPAGGGPIITVDPHKVLFCRLLCPFLSRPALSPTPHPHPHHTYPAMPHCWCCPQVLVSAEARRDMDQRAQELADDQRARRADCRVVPSDVLLCVKGAVTAAAASAAAGGATLAPGNGRWYVVISTASTSTSTTAGAGAGAGGVGGRRKADDEDDDDNATQATATGGNSFFARLRGGRGARRAPLSDVDTCYPDRSAMDATYQSPTMPAFDAAAVAQVGGC